MTTRTRQSKLRKAPPPKGVNWTLIGVGGAVVVLLAVLAYAIAQASAPLPGQAVAIQSRDHVQPGEGHPPFNNRGPEDAP